VADAGRRKVAEAVASSGTRPGQSGRPPGRSRTPAVDAT